MRAVAVQAQRAAYQHDPAVAHRVDVLTGDRVGQRDRRLAGVGPVLAADVQLAAAQVDPLALDTDVDVVGDGQPAVDRQAAQGRRIDGRLTEWSQIGRA